MKKRSLLTILLLLIALGGIGLVILIGVKNAQTRERVMAHLSGVLGVEVSCQQFSYNPLTAYLSIKTLRVGSPPPYKAYHAFALENVEVRFHKADPKTGEFYLRSLRARNVDLNYETAGLAENNLLELLHLLETRVNSSTLKVAVDSLQLDHIYISVSASRMEREQATLETQGFALQTIGSSEAPTDPRGLFETLTRAFLLHSTHTIVQNSTKPALYQFRLGAEPILRQQHERDPDLAAQLKL